MAAASTIIAAASLAVAAGSAAYSIKSSEDAKGDAKVESKKREAAAKRQTDALYDKQASEEKEQQTEATRAQALEQKRAKAGISRRDTILTSPLGVTGDANTAGKTLLGQ